MTATTWVPGAAGSGFDLDHLPYGAFARGTDAPRVGVRIGDFMVELAPLAADDRLPITELLEANNLDLFLAAGPEVWEATRSWITIKLSDETHRAAVESALVPMAEATLHPPFTVGDYVDFYASLDHATNVGKMFRPDGDALLPNWRHLPVGYHGRGGTVVPSDTPIIRPQGQRKGPNDPEPVFGPSIRLDIEAELGFVIGTGNSLGAPIAVTEAEDHLFGVVGFNDWSARDIQAWEYVPLGPHLGKSFATSISHLVTPMAALEAAWTPLPGQDPKPLPYLTDGDPQGLDIDVEVELNGEVVARPPYRTMYWAPAQMLAHLTVNGASTRPGDIFASGTISGPEKDQRGSLLELSWSGQEPFTVNGEQRSFLEDGDEVVLRYSAPGTGGGRITFGEVRGRIEPALTR